LKVVLYGATGKSGSIILTELVDRGHLVIAATRNPEKVRKVKNVTAVQDDLSNPAKTASIVKGADAVVSAYGPPPDDLVRSSALRIGSFKASSRPVGPASS
jgi:uncharacterized protein